MNAINILNKSLELDKSKENELIELITAAKIVLINDYETSMREIDTNTNNVAKVLVDLNNNKGK